MSTKYNKADIVMQTWGTDLSGIFAGYMRSDAANSWNNNIHYHNFWEIEFVMSGSGVYEINNKKSNIERGMLFLTTPADFHTYYLRENESFEHYCVQFLQDQIDDRVSSLLFSCAEPVALHLEGKTFETMRAEFENLVEVFSERTTFYEIQARNCIENICIEISHEVGKQKPETKDYPVIRNAIIYVKNNYRENITLRTAALHVGLSESYFSNLFSGIMGIGFSAYVRDVRLNAAADLLKTNEFTIKEVCYKTGFNNPNYFSGAFRDKFGVAPREYRENYRRDILNLFENYS